MPFIPDMTPDIQAMSCLIFCIIMNNMRIDSHRVAEK
jgi:hypothetical protein